ncbi:TPA: hypothetical protein ACH3X2_012373 [Trebouxia sp. C0005]
MGPQAECRLFATCLTLFTAYSDKDYSVLDFFKVIAASAAYSAPQLRVQLKHKTLNEGH